MISDRVVDDGMLWDLLVRRCLFEICQTRGGLSHVDPAQSAIEEYFGRVEAKVKPKLFIVAVVSEVEGALRTLSGCPGGIVEHSRSLPALRRTSRASEVSLRRRGTERQRHRPWVELTKLLTPF